MNNRTLRRIFRITDEVSMIPMLHAGMGSLISNPVTGYMMLLHTVGRKSGRSRFTPMNYAVVNGSVYCLARWGTSADWVRNVIVHPEVEVKLPGRSFTGVAKAVTDPDERYLAIRAVLKSGGFAGFSQGFNPFTASRDRLLAGTAKMIAIRIRVTGIATGRNDPGGSGWVIPVVVVAWFIVNILKGHRVNTRRWDSEVER